MSKILVVAESGFGKTTSLMKDEEYGIEGLDPRVTYIITVTSKPLPGKGSRLIYPAIPVFSAATTVGDLRPYRRLILTDAALIAKAITLLGTVPIIQNVVLDDTNYIMQDYYMEKALSTGWDTPKKIGFDMGRIFQAFERFPEGKNFIMLAHGEEYDKADGRKGYRMKTTGKMVKLNLCHNLSNCWNILRAA